MDIETRLHAPQSSSEFHSHLRSLYSGRRVVVAGVTGFIGLNVALALREANATVIGLSRRTTPLARFACSEMVGIDLIDGTGLTETLADVDIVFDCIGYPALAPSDLVPDCKMDAEFRPHLNLFSACLKQKRPPTVVHVGTRLVYGTPSVLPVDEAHPLNPGSIYAAHRLLVEHHLKVLGRTHELPSVVFRLSSPYGPSGSMIPGRLGVWNLFIAKALRGEAISIYGTGEQLRDFVYVEDVAAALLLGAVTPSCVDEVFNLGGERAMSLRDAVGTIAEEAGGTPVEYTPWPATARRVETGDYRSNLTKLKQHLPQLPRQTDFRDGVRRTMAIMRGRSSGRLSSPTPPPRRTSAAANRVTETLQGQRILIVGASGFLGAALAARFCKEGATVFALSRKLRRLNWLVSSGACDFLACDLMNAQATESAVREASPDIVICVAAIPDGDETAPLIRERLANNVFGLVNLLEACRVAAPHASFVYGDSRKVYGNAAGPHGSTTPSLPQSSYAISKQTGWNLCLLYERLHGLSVVSIRPSLIYGPEQGRNLISNVADAARDGLRSIELNGGAQTRDPLFIDDAIDAFVAAARRADALRGQAIAIGGIEELPVRDLAQLVLDVCGSDATLVCNSDTMRPTEMLQSTCDLSEVAMLLDWAPRVPLREGLERTLRARLPRAIAV